jgi:two-component system sensor histidine kinase KdpD
VPDDVVAGADEVELVDLSPEALRRRLARGDLYPAEEVDAVLANTFRAENLGALRELALRWLADRIDVTEPWDTRERVLVAITGAPGSEHLIRRAARIAGRAHGELLGVHVGSDTGLADSTDSLVDDHRRLLEDLGGRFQTVTSGDVATALLDVARAENSTQIVLGASRRSRWQRMVRGSVINSVVRQAGPIDVHVISADASEEERRALPLPRRVLTPVSRRRQAWGWALVAVGLPALTLVLAHSRDHVHLPTVLLLYLMLSLTVALVGGTFPALVAVLGGFLLADYYFSEPLYRLSISEAEVQVALAVYVASAAIVCVLVDRVGRLGLEAGRSRAEAEAMAGLAGSLAEEEALPGLIAHLRATFGMRGASLLRRDGDRWRAEATDGPAPPTDPARADVVHEVGPDLVLALSGRELGPADLRVLAALAGQLATAVEARRLQAEAERASELSEANDLRTALLQSVSHDLRTPLAAIKASVSSLRQGDVAWSDEDVREFQRTIEDEADRLDTLVGNLLDMSRLQAGTLTTSLRPVALEEVVPGALAALGERSRGVEVDVAETLPPVRADAALLERVLGNLVDNALSASPPDGHVRLEAGCVPDAVDVRVVDHGPGIAPADRDRVFEPFQRTTDHGGGVGLGLAIARGFLDAMGGELSIEDTPGGGTTMVVRLELA